jgi:hypothetical protein
MFDRLQCFSDASTKGGFQMRHKAKLIGPVKTVIIITDGSGTEKLPNSGFICYSKKFHWDRKRMFLFFIFALTFTVHVQSTPFPANLRPCSPFLKNERKYNYQTDQKTQEKQWGINQQSIVDLHPIILMPG